MEIQTNFSKAAEVLLKGETGIYQFSYEAIPAVGDKLSVRTSPSERVLTFVCVERHFDFSAKGSQSLVLLFDVPEQADTSAG